MNLQERAKKQAELIKEVQDINSYLAPFNEECATIESIDIFYTPFSTEDREEGPMQKIMLIGTGRNNALEQAIQTAVKNAVESIINPRIAVIQSEIDKLENA